MFREIEGQKLSRPPDLTKTQSGSDQQERLEPEFRNLISSTILLFNIAMENDPFIVSFPIKNGDFP